MNDTRTAAQLVEASLAAMVPHDEVEAVARGEAKAALTELSRRLAEAHRMNAWLADQCSSYAIIYRDPVRYRIEPDYWLAAADLAVKR